MAAAAADGLGALSQRPKVMTEEERRQWRTNQLMEKGGEATKKGLSDGSLYVGAEGQVMRREQSSESDPVKSMQSWARDSRLLVDEMDGVKVELRTEDGSGRVRPVRWI